MSYNVFGSDVVSGGKLCPVRMRVRQFNPINKRNQTLERWAKFFIPDSVCDQKGVSLLIAFHGAGEDGNGFRTRTSGLGYDEEAAREGMIVAYPDGYQGYWNDFRPSNKYPPKMNGVDDIAFTKELIKVAVHQWGVKKSKIFLTGYSNGAHLVFTLLSRLGAKYIAGAAVHCAGFPDVENLKKLRNHLGPVPICIINGTLDPVNPYQGGKAVWRGLKGTNKVIELGNVLSGENTMYHYKSQFKGLIRHETSVDPDNVMDVSQWSIGCGKVVVRLISMIGEGHFVPFGAGRKATLSIGPRRGEVNAPREAMNFIKDCVCTCTFSERCRGKV